MAGKRQGGRGILTTEFATLLAEVKGRILEAQTRAVLAVNSELVRLYWDIGRMMTFYREYSDRLAVGLDSLEQLLAAGKVPQPVAQIHFDPKVPQPVALFQDSLLWSVPWAHHVVLIEKVKDLPTRRWYMEQTLVNGWSRNVLALQIDAEAHARRGKAVSNFAAILPPPQSDLAQQTLKDPYIFDFLTLEEPFRERELETQLVRHLEAFLLELGQGFAFVGRQYRLDVGGEDFYIDLLFYHLRLRAFIVIDLKKGKFRPEYAGKLNFYCNVVNDRLKQSDDQPTIGLILCQERDRLLAEYSFAGIDKPIGISTYELTRALPRELQSALPTVEEIEAELSGNLKPTPRTRRRES
ncbi:MAG: PDDEXK nuclease domain-containing protein [bacterium]